MAKAKSQRDALTQRLKDIVNDALRANAARSPSVTDLAHANNMAMQAEAERLRLAKAEQKPVKKLKQQKKRSGKQNANVMRLPANRLKPRIC